MTYRAFRYSGIFYMFILTVKTGLELCWKIQNLCKNMVLRIQLSMQSICHFSPFLPTSRDWSQQLICAVSRALSSLFCLLLLEDFVSFARLRCTLWTVVVSILLQQETQQLLANATLKLNQCPFFKIKQETAVKSCEKLWKSVKLNTNEAQQNTFVCVSAWPYTLWLDFSS